MTKEEERAERQRAQKRKYREANKEKILAAHREYNSRPEVKARAREYEARKRREAGVPERPPKMTDEERIAKRRARQKIRSEKLRREAGVPVRTRMSDEERRLRRNAQSVAYYARNIEKAREIGRLSAERSRRARGVPVKLKLPDAAARKERKRELLKKWRSEHRRAYNAQANEYVKKNSVKIRARALKAYWADPDKSRDMALIGQLARDLHVVRKDLPQELVEARLALVRVKRKVKELSK